MSRLDFAVEPEVVAVGGRVLDRLLLLCGPDDADAQAGRRHHHHEHERPPPEGQGSGRGFFSLLILAIHSERGGNEQIVSGQPDFSPYEEEEFVNSVDLVLLQRTRLR